MTIVELSEEQRAALGRAEAFALDPLPDRRFFVLHGLAGTGKTTTLAALAARHADALLCAFTGKAASVLRAKTGLRVGTLHAAIYDFRGLVEDEWDDRRMNPVFVAKDAPLPDRVVLLDECFVAGTLVDTPTGRRRIEKLRPGDLILNASGVDRVKNIVKNEGFSLAQINTGTETITCSKDHPFFTKRGLIRAANLRSGDQLARTGASMRFLYDTVHTSVQSFRTILHRELWAALECKISRISESIYSRAHRKDCRNTQIVAEKYARRAGARQMAPVGRYASNAEPRNSSKDGHYSQGNWILRPDVEWGKWPRSHEITTRTKQDSWSDIYNGVRGFAGTATEGTTDQLQVRSCKPRHEDWDRTKWLVSPATWENRTRQEKDSDLNWVGVEDIIFLEPRDYRLDQYRDARGKLYLYDLEAERHHSFSVNGILVHNCSMIGQKLARDLLATGARVIACGDPGQLPPVRDAQFFTDPDVTLERVHRQALGSPIIRQAHRVRNEGCYEADTEAFRVVERASPEDLLAADMILCWRNRTRTRLNQRKRELLGLAGPLRAGEPVMCLKNDHRRGLYNGAVYELAADTAEDDRGLAVRVDGHELLVDLATVEGQDPVFDKRRYDEDYLPFAPAYAATCHKAQGSEWPAVLLFDEAETDWAQFTYTGLTRAVDRVTVVRWR